MAIMKLNRMAAEPVYKDKVVFVTVNCDECVRARVQHLPGCQLEWSAREHVTNLGATLELTEHK